MTIHAARVIAGTAGVHLDFRDRMADVVIDDSLFANPRMIAP
ncbi:hypothetical protein [Saccharopolyspora hordei]|uniref:Uncharacterized protein n=1 Tax=Saccharopolyspora hordei TaxID=1838 RepID=A0A853AVI1_9PSEU|nr:hypothetical protein [Saccharopolyspora hordei]NYI86662.1 hypothetical protein [Saccharopolyspora hordei]